MPIEMLGRIAQVVESRVFAIKVTGFPKATKNFSVGLVDVKVPTMNHGGETIPNDGSGMIPSAAFDDYVGPCLTGSTSVPVHRQGTNASAFIH
jgi:hypothetical protein